MPIYSSLDMLKGLKDSLKMKYYYLILKVDKSALNKYLVYIIANKKLKVYFLCPGFRKIFLFLFSEE